jgi:hypothetical protein
MRGDELKEKTSTMSEIADFVKEVEKLCPNKVESIAEKLKISNVETFKKTALFYGFEIDEDGNLKPTEAIRKILNYDEKNEILEILKDPDLFERINREFDKKIVREEDTRKAIFLCSCGRLVKNCNLASYNLIINSESGAGKDWVTDNVLRIWGEGIYVKRTRISEKVFTYWHNPKFEPEWTWDGKIFYNEDISNNVLNSDVFKVMASSGSSATVLINQRPVDIEIRGKPVIMITTASNTPSKELLRRFVIVNLDEGIHQTREIMKRQGELAESGISDEYDEMITKALQTLKRVKVKIPYASKLYKFFPADHVIMRTNFNRFLDLIKASAALHQFQRENDGEYIYANGQDYDIARQVLLKTTSNQSMIPLTKNQKKLLEILNELGDNWSSVSDLEPKVTFMSESQLRRELDRLVGYGFLLKDKEHREGSRKPVMVYQRKKFTKISIPTWEGIKDEICN